MRITNNGNIGIGIASPATKLHIEGQITVSSSSVAPALLFQNNDTAIAYAMSAGNYSSSANAGDLVIRSATDKGIILQSGSGVFALAINASTNNVSFSASLLLPSSWRIVIGTYGGVANSLGLVHNDNAVWYFRGNTGAGSWDISDERTKKEIKPIENALSIIEKLEPKKYIKLVDRDEIKECGIIAQDAEKIDEIKNYVYNEPYYTPDIYEDCEYDNETKIFISTKDQSLILKVGIKIKIVLDKKEGEFDMNNINSSWCCVETEIIEVIDEFTFKLKNDVDIKETDIFIYGTFKEDFKTIDYKSLYTINLQATKDLYKLVQNLQERILILENKPL
jgi:hypothetical protein